MNTTSKILLGSLLLALAVGMTTTTVAQVNDDATQSSTVDVGIASDTGLDVRPVSFSYTSVNPGSQTTSASSGVSAIEIENIGSENISDIWMGASKPDSDPFGTGIAAQYDAGNFIQVNTTGVDREPGGISPTDHPHYVSRVEYVEPAPTFLQLPDAGTVGSADSSLVGRFRAADEWWFYAIFYDSATQDGDNLCGSAQSGEDELVYIGKQAHDAGTTGTIDFTDTSNVEIYEIENISDSSAYGVLNETVTIDPSGSETRDYSMLTFCDSTNIDTDSHIQRVHYDIDAKNPVTGGNTGQITTGAASYLMSTSTQADMLKPGQHFPMDIRIEVPEGVAQGDVSTGTLTVYAISDT